MNIRSFLWDKLLDIIFCLVGIIVTSVFIGIITDAGVAALILAVWAAFLLLYCIVSYMLLRKRIAKIRKIIRETDNKSLLSELMPVPLRSEDRLYYETMLIQGKAAIDIVTRAEKDKADYYDYISQWVHEFKTPLAAIGLICANNKGDAFNDIAVQLGRLNNYGEQMLYEIKSNNIEKDLIIKEIDLLGIVNECIKDNKRLFIGANIGIEVEGIDVSVYSDEKWTAFILKQLLYNCVQYCKTEGARINISGRQTPDGRFELSIYDNGIGIQKSELPRIYDKGFTGSNGRKNKKSTGLGLYICQKLCYALDVQILAQSEYGEYTRITLTFKSV